MLRICGLIIMRTKTYDEIRRNQTLKIIELMAKNRSLEFNNKNLQDMLRAREGVINKLIGYEIPRYEKQN